MKINSFLFSLVILSFSLHSCNDSGEADGPGYYKIKPAVSITVTESGQLESIYNSMVTAPGNWNTEYRIADMSAEGSFVNEGDTVVYFNTESAQSELDEAQSKLELQQEKYAETLKKNEVSIREKKNAIEQLQWQLKINENQVEQARYESDSRLKESELELEKTRLNLKKANDDLAAQQIINQKNADLIKLEISQARVQIERARNTMSDLFLVAPKGGMVIYQRQGWGGDGEKIRIGESVFPQSAILAIPDLNKMQALVKLNEVDRPLVKEGLKAEILVEAYPDTVFSGRVRNISKIVNIEDDATNLKTYDMEVEITSHENFRLKPGLSARITVFLDSLENAYQIPSWCLGWDGKKFFVNEKEDGLIFVRLLQLRDGNAYIRGEVSDEMALRPVF